MRSWTLVSGLTHWTCSLSPVPPSPAAQPGRCSTFKTKWPQKSVKVGTWQVQHGNVWLWEEWEGTLKWWWQMLTVLRFPLFPQNFTQAKMLIGQKEIINLWFKPLAIFMLLQFWVSLEVEWVPYHFFSTLEHFANPAFWRWLGGQDTDLEPDIGLSIGSHRDCMLRLGKLCPSTATSVLRPLTSTWKSPTDIPLLMVFYLPSLGISCQGSMVLNGFGG